MFGSCSEPDQPVFRENDRTQEGEYGEPTEHRPCLLPLDGGAPEEFDAGVEETLSRTEEKTMEQDKGYKGADQKRKVSLKEWWSEARPTKTAVFWSWVGSVILTMIIGFAWGGWVTGGTARSMAEKMAEDAVVKRLAPICVVQFKQAPGKDQKLEELGKTDSWKRSEYVEKQGWATLPGEEKPDSKVAEECARLLMLIGK